MPTFSIANELSHFPPQKRKEVMSRLAELRMRAAEYGGVQVRDDSQMAWRWATGAPGAETIDMHTALSQMGTSQFVYAKTDYGDTCEADFKVMANAIHSNYPELRWSMIWTIVRRHAPTVLKINALARAGYCEGVPSEQFRQEV